MYSDWFCLICNSKIAECFKNSKTKSNFNDYNLTIYSMFKEMYKYHSCKKMYITVSTYNLKTLRVYFIVRGYIII